MQKRFIILSLLLLSLFGNSFAQEIPDKPNPPKLVNDFAQIMSSTETSKLETYLEQFARETSTQIVVVTTPSLDGTDVADYAFKLGQKWGIGQKGKDNGIIMIIKPKTTSEKGRAFIATGYGLEGVLPDAIARQIVDNEMIPYFKQNNYFGGIAAAVQTVTDITRGEYTADQYQAKHKKGSPSLGIIGILFIVIIISIISKSSKHHNRNNMGSGSSLPFWLLLSAMNSSSRNSGSFGNFSSGSGGFGGGGFGGFGGGGFGGGGAGGSW